MIQKIETKRKRYPAFETFILIVSAKTGIMTTLHQPKISIKDFSIKAACFLSDKFLMVLRSIYPNHRFTDCPQDRETAAKTVGMSQKRFFDRSQPLKKAIPVSQAILFNREVIFDNSKIKVQ